MYEAFGSQGKYPDPTSMLSHHWRIHCGSARIGCSLPSSLVPAQRGRIQSRWSLASHPPVSTYTQWVCMPPMTHALFRRLAGWVSVLLASSLLGMGLRLVLSVLGVFLLQGLGNLAAIGVSRVPSADPVYTRAMLRSVADLHVQGLAIGGPPGAALHALLPALVVDPARAHLALARIALEPGSALVARLLAAGFAHAGMLTVGTLLVRAGWLRHRMHLMLLGLAVQAQVALSVLGAQPSVRELEATGMSFAANALLPWLWQRGRAFTDGLGGVPPNLLTASLVTLALLVGYIPAGCSCSYGRGRESSRSDRHWLSY